jgi:hypothetical protein
MKSYSPDQANRALPLVRRIVEDVVRSHRRLIEVAQQLALLSSDMPAGRSDPRVTVLEREALSLTHEMDAYERELEVLGVSLKDRQMGLIDFPGERDGRRVWLCWRLGEPAVRYWHELEAGFAGRQPLQEAVAG